MSTRSFSPESARFRWMCNTRISSTQLCFRDQVKLAQISQAPLWQITWHGRTLACSTHPAAVIQDRDQKLVSSNGRSNTILCSILAEKAAVCVFVFVWYPDKVNSIKLYYLTTSLILFCILCCFICRLSKCKEARTQDQEIPENIRECV